jgi:hypothetical protein
VLAVKKHGTGRYIVQFTSLILVDKENLLASIFLLYKMCLM